MVWFNNPITRTRYLPQTFDAEGNAVWTVESTGPLSGAGSQMPTDADLQSLPEGDRLGVTKKVFCRRGDLRPGSFVADQEVPADRVTIDGAVYEVRRIMDRRHLLPHDEVLVVRISPYAEDPTA